MADVVAGQGWGEFRDEDLGARTTGGQQARMLGLVANQVPNLPGNRRIFGPGMTDGNRHRQTLLTGIILTEPIQEFVFPGHDDDARKACPQPFHIGIRQSFDAGLPLVAEEVGIKAGYIHWIITIDNVACMPPCTRRVTVNGFDKIPPWKGEVIIYRLRISQHINHSLAEFRGVFLEWQITAHGDDAFAVAPADEGTTVGEERLQRGGGIQALQRQAPAHGRIKDPGQTAFQAFMKKGEGQGFLSSLQDSLLFLVLVPRAHALG